MRRHVVLMFIVWTQTFLTRKHVFIVLKHKIIACKFQNFLKMVTWFVLKRTLRTVSVVMDTRMRTSGNWNHLWCRCSVTWRQVLLPTHTWAAGTRLLYTPRSHYISSRRHLTHPTIMCCDTHTDPYPCSRSGWRGHTWLVSISPSEHRHTSSLPLPVDHFTWRTMLEPSWGLCHVGGHCVRMLLIVWHCQKSQSITCEHLWLFSNKCWQLNGGEKTPTYDSKAKHPGARDMWLCPFVCVCLCLYIYLRCTSFKQLQSVSKAFIKIISVCHWGS